MDANVISVTEKSDASPASSLEAMHDAMHRAQAVFLRDMTERIKACGETLELCVDELNQTGLGLSSNVFKTWRAAEKYLYQLIADLEAECAELTEPS
jgi:hypothetical protein